MSFKICTIGCGRHSSATHGPSYKKYAGLSPGVELAACCDINESAAAVFKENFGFTRYYTSIDVMLDAERPHAVCLVAPVEITAKLSVNILEKGYPLIMEKPPGLNRNETMSMIKAAESRNVPNQVALNRRHMPLVRKLKEMLNNYRSEQIQNIRCDFYRVNRRDVDFSTTAIHGIDMVKNIAGSDYRHIYFNYQQLLGYGPNVVNIFMYCIFESGASAQLSFCPISSVAIENLSVSTGARSFFVELPVFSAFNNEGHILHVVKNKVEEKLSDNEVTDGPNLFETNGFYAENASFFDDIQNGRFPKDDVKSGLQSVEIAECIRMRKSEYKASKAD